MRYELRFKSRGGKVFATDCLDAEDDTEALESAERRYRTCRDLMFEVWRDGECIAAGVNPNTSGVRPTLEPALRAILST